jgi:hypothetical protein
MKTAQKSGRGDNDLGNIQFGAPSEEQVSEEELK